MRAPWHFGRTADGFTKILRLDQKIARNLFTGFDEGAVSHQRFAFPHSHHDCRRCWLQRRRMNVLSRGMQLVRQFDGFGEELRLRLLVHFLEGVFVMMHDQHELHRVAPGMIAVGCLRAPVFFERPNLDAPILGCGKFRRDPYGVVEVSDIDE